MVAPKANSILVRVSLVEHEMRICSTRLRLLLLLAGILGPVTYAKLRLASRIDFHVSGINSILSVRSRSEAAPASPPIRVAKPTTGACFQMAGSSRARPRTIRRYVDLSSPDQISHARIVPSLVIAASVVPKRACPGQSCED